MADDHDRCEWVNVSSGTGSPGCPIQNTESRKIVVCVCVCVCVTERGIHTCKTVNITLQ